ncbi:DUF308 domain-containing protein [Methylobacterium gnaphalii]|uniref:Membrane protein n=1 Tax=Methylobacterium gnaphalii TaxID=1010610 RepID=A0A512JJZ8_9HYPH|nr:DUF308 domain-containing protein [Methylobacterium gnaphalii]GEP10274.1 membrane protein [Methylobacterium gnaphalii]GJD68628.1 hypothetical protein MMMDOFMJ_1552 [Methylobacterium gnaphalii]GLS50624.1 membrane protein [Methylobacterium gnaphalii]
MNTVAPPNWLRSYYVTRAGVAAAWVLAAFTVGKSNPTIAAALLIAYPAWDALANLIDARRSGGLRASPSQTVNAVVSVITTIAVAIALGWSPYAVLAVFGAWAALSGLSQLATGIRRWDAGGQWAMVLSGAQSALAGAFFIMRAAGPDMPGIADVAPYAAFGAFYFLVSAAWLTVVEMRKHSAQRAA